jgi:uncharacterized protein YqgC (DUF456 family)
MAYRKYLLQTLVVLLEKHPTVIIPSLFTLLAGVAIYFVTVSYLQHSQDFFVYSLTLVLALAAALLVNVLFLLRIHR